MAIKKTKGEYVAFADTDDWWHKKKLQKQIELIKSNNDLKVVYSNIYIFNQNKGEKKLFHKKEICQRALLLKNY